MSTITISLPDEVLAFLESYSASLGTSAEALLARHARNLQENLQRELSPEVVAASGIIDPTIDGRAAYLEYLEKKHA